MIPSMDPDRALATRVAHSSPRERASVGRTWADAVAQTRLATTAGPINERRRIILVAHLQPRARRGRRPDGPAPAHGVTVKLTFSVSVLFPILSVTLISSR